MVLYKVLVETLYYNHKETNHTAQWPTIGGPICYSTRSLQLMLGHIDK